MKFKSTSIAWQSLTMPRQFLLAGAAVMILATITVETWVSNRIQAGVVQNSAISAALFMESYISPLSQDLALSDSLSPSAQQALEGIFEGTALGERVVSFKIWAAGGRIVHASDPVLIGQTFEPSDDLMNAWQGEISASFEDLNDVEDAAEAAMGIPLLEVYSPIRQAWTGDVIAVAEFYENATELSKDVANAHRSSWIVVGGAFLISGILLFGIVQAGGRTIREQQLALREQLDTTRKISGQNAELRRKAVAASSRATAQTERAIRRIGFDLHDGPAQYLSLASLRLDSALESAAAPSKDVSLVRGSLDKALDELRIISRGLALPDLDGHDIAALILRAVKDHESQTDMRVQIHEPLPSGAALNYAQKLCAFRFLQETLSNVSRHARTDRAEVITRQSGKSLSISVSDKGCGFDLNKPLVVRDDGGQGLFSLKDRAESIGGTLDIKSSKNKGTQLTLTLPFEENSE